MQKELAYSAHRHVLRVSKRRPRQYPMLCTFKSAILFKVQSLTFLLFFFFTHRTGFGGLQRCWTRKISWRIQFQQATTGADPQQTWAEIQTCVKPGKAGLIIMKAN